MASGLRPTPLALIVLALLSACSHTRQPTPRSMPETPTAPADSAFPGTTGATVPPPTPVPLARKWIDLAVGDCLVDPPSGDPSVVMVKVVDCAAPHAAEVYSRVPVAVDAAVASVANRECATEFDRYTGQSDAASSFTVTYLIDSNQDRTVGNPEPSTVICLLQAADGQPVAGSARS